MINSEETILNQDNREVIIKILDDKKERVELEDLFLYDLSPYYKENLDDSFFSKQLEFIQEKNRLSHNPEISFTSEQIKIYQGIVESNRSIVSAPTSFGKTMLIKEYIFNYQPNKVVFIVPTNSLADELLDGFKILFTDYDYVIFDSIKNLEVISEKSIFIGTQEKYYNLKGFYQDKIDLFVIDEAYKLTDSIKGSREVILNRSFIDTLENSEKIILLMPLVNSIIGLENFNFQILKSDYAPVAKNFNSIKNLDQTINQEISKNEITNLIYFNSPQELEKVYLKNLKSIKNSVELNGKWVQRVEEDFHSEWIPIQALKSGIGIHYGPMPKFIQKKVIDLFKSNQIKSVLATNSIIEGVNTPTKNIYIYSSRDLLGGKNLVKYKNLIGRAGRLGEHKVGNIYYFEKHQAQFDSANVSYKDIDIQFLLENKAEIIEINRDENFDKEFASESSSSHEDKLQKHLENSSYSNVPSKEIISLLNNHGFTVNKFTALLDYIASNKNVMLLGIIGKLVGRTDLNSLKVILNSRFKSFSVMVDELHSKNQQNDKSKIISTLIDMIYNFLPFKIIPLINFIIDVDVLYHKYANENLLPTQVIVEAKRKKAQFYSKFIGVDNPTHETLVIMNKLFEYGIPYQRANPFLEIITSNLPDKFSIHDIKKIIIENEGMNDLRVYFE
ncbi:DEAD/DEAH box helicase family protein [Flavobacterium sp. NST-5]|uniref:DEAD/DEAH box helicase family protein n=1 Tax=Flavobacterium ichthyis TaxID=2698827 RepID=A0ABW9ZAC4_9FLAO|nr:DEAD/DEAH box helicase family protein [Flavobacterium ichthyis]NBL65853.1 DEAD/DEAH box helicase family protein [Flavobacterium ichthyis]